MVRTHSKEKLKWHLDILPRSTRKALEFFSQASWLKRSRWYLAGGTGLALYEGHRESLDLDFFLPLKDFSLASLVAKLPSEKWTTDIAREGTLYGRLGGASISFIANPSFVSIERPRWFGNVRILSPRDIAVMKIIAISQRGRKRDFFDIYWHTRHYESLGDVLRKLPRQYPSVAHNYYHILKSLVYFSDAEEDPMPRTPLKVSWTEIKSYFQREVPRIALEFLRLA